MQDDLDQHIYPAFPSSVHCEVMAILPYLRQHRHARLSIGTFDVLCMGEQLQIPIRIYTDIPRQNGFQNFSDTAKLLLYALYTRHSDGFIRQQMLRQLLKLSPNPMMIPFIFQLLGEYVIEILSDIEPFIQPQTQTLFTDFMQQNPAYWAKTERRIISYWNEYYRKIYPNFNDYIGAKILQKLKSFDENNQNPHD